VIRNLPAQAYLVTTVTQDRKPIFLNFWLARCAIAQLRRLHTQGDVDSLAWVLMPDHLHWLFQLTDGASLAKVMQRFKGCSARAIHVSDPDQGSVWQANYYDRALRTEENVRSVARYIIANPIRAGLVDKVGDYPHWDAVWV